MKPEDKYWVSSKRYPTGYKPVSWLPHWTKSAHPRKWKPEIYHAPLVKADAPPPVEPRQRNDVKLLGKK